MEELNLDEIEKALGEITQGEWIFWEEYTEDRGTNYGVKCKGPRHWIFPPLNIEKKDVKLIAHAPEWLRLLVERVRTLESDKEMAEDDASHFCAGLCVHPRGVIGDDGGSACCPITGTRDALVDGKKVVL